MTPGISSSLNSCPESLILQLVQQQRELAGTARTSPKKCGERGVWGTDVFHWKADVFNFAYYLHREKEMTENLVL